MRVRMVRGLGVRKALKVAKEVQKEGAIVLQHTLDVRTPKGGIRLLGKRDSMLPEGDVHLLTVVLPAQDGGGYESALIYREVDIPLAQRGKLGDEWQYKSEAMVVIRKGDIVQLVAASVNGGLIYPNMSSRSDGPGLKYHCGGCWDIINGPWEYDWGYCASWDLGCMAGCAASCVQCRGCGSWWVCVACAFGCVHCPGQCCSHWVDTCAQCLAP